VQDENKISIANNLVMKSGNANPDHGENILISKTYFMVILFYFILFFLKHTSCFATRGKADELLYAIRRRGISIR